MHRAVVALIGMALIAPGMVIADDKKEETKDKSQELVAKLIGKWEVTKADDSNLVGAMVQFEKDGKMLITVKLNDQEIQIEGSYKIKDGKLVTESKESGESDTDTFKKFEGDVLVLENKDMKVTELKRKK